MSLSHGFSIELLGLRLGFSGSPGLATDLVQRYVFPGLPRQALKTGGESAEATFRLEEADHRGVVLLQQAVDEYCISHATGFTFVHAGVIGIDGAAALLVGSSGHGKSTLVAELIGSARHARSAGKSHGRSVTYFSDEYAAIDEQGRLHPYPRALLIRAGRPEQHPVLPADLGAQVADSAGEIRLILNLPYREGTQTRMSPVGQSEGLRLLLEHTPQVLEESPALFKNLTRVARNARTFIGARGDAAEAGDAILELLHAP